MNTKLIIVFVAILSTFKLTAQSEKAIPSKLESATILRIGAELIHSAKLNLISGNNELIIEDLSASIDANSLQIKCSGGVTIMGSEFLKDYISEKIPAQGVKKLQDSIEYYSREIAKFNVILATNKELQSLLQANKSIGGQQAGLSVAELIKMMDYYKSKSSELQTEKSETEEKLRKIGEKIEKFRYQLDQESLKYNKTTGKLKLKLACPLAGAYDLKLSYYTSSAYWVPYYDIQAGSSDKPLKMIAKAKFMQTTGMDWKRVGLTLSTSTPNNGKTAPILSAWFLQYIQPLIGADAQMSERRMEMDEVVALASQNTVSYKDAKRLPGSNAASTPVNNGPIYVLDGRVISQEEFSKIDQNMIAGVDVLKGAEAAAIYGAAASEVIVISLKNNFVTESENQTDITYNIDLPYDVLGTGSEQSVTLRTIDVPVNYEYYSVPKLDKSVYLIAEVKNWAQYNLMPGEANITHEGTYVGKSFMDPNSTKETLHLTFANDKRIAVKREKIQDFSSTKFLGNDKNQVFTYQLTVKNNKNIPVQMILKDQYPISTDKGIVIELLETSNAHNNSEVGTLTWEFPLKPGESKAFKMSYSVKFPKDKEVDL